MYRTFLVVIVILSIPSFGFFVSFDEDNRTLASEIAGDTDPLNSDTDGDGLKDGEEVNKYGSDPNKPDTDGNGITDGKEVDKYGTDPTKLDTDGDGMTDTAEINRGTDPTSKPECDAYSKDTDTDTDGLNNYEECRLGTNPDDMDTDGDSLTDYEEIKGVTSGGIEIPESNPNHMDLYVTVVETSGINFDTVDEDELAPGKEKDTIRSLFANMSVSNPNGQKGIDIHFKTVEEPDKTIKTRDLSAFGGSIRMDESKNDYLRKYSDRTVHTIIVLTEGYDGGLALDNFAYSHPRWYIASHEIMHTVIGEIEGSECPRGERLEAKDKSHICSEDTLMNANYNLPYDRDTYLSDKTVREIEENGFFRNN